jgi:hypothetical protein
VEKFYTITGVFTFSALFAYLLRISKAPRGLRRGNLVS